MKKASKTHNMFAAVVAISMALSAVPSTALAGPQTLEAAWGEYEAISMEVANAGESLNDIRWQREQAEKERIDLEERISEGERKLRDSQKSLKVRVASQYRFGSTSLIDILLDASSWEGLVASIRQLNKSAQRDCESVDETVAMMEDLRQQKARLDEKVRQIDDLIEAQGQKIKELDGALERQRGYIDSLSEPLSTEFEGERATEIIDMQLQAVDQMSQEVAGERHSNENDSDGASSGNSMPASAPETINGASQGSDSPVDTGDSQTSTDAVAVDGPSDTQSVGDSVLPVSNNATLSVEENASTPSEVASSKTASESEGDEPVVTDDLGATGDDVRAKILEAAYSQIGVPYVYGASSPGEAFDCSGLTSWAYSQAGIDIPHSSAAQAEMATATSMDELQAGDLVFYIGNVGASQSGNHVAIYAGDGQVIHANGSEVVVSPMNESYTSVGSFA